MFLNAALQLLLLQLLFVYLTIPRSMPGKCHEVTKKMEWLDKRGEWSLRRLFVVQAIWAMGMFSCATAEIQKCPDTADIRQCPDTKTAPSHVKDQLFIVFNKGTESSRIHEINEIFNVTVVKENLGGRITLIKIPTGSSIENMCRAYYAFSEVKGVNLNYIGIRPL